MTLYLKTIPADGQCKVKLEKIKLKFEDDFGCVPDFYVRAPGRVNLIGEHIDYCGYPVFPMAVQQDITVGVAKRQDNKLSVANIDAKFESFECDINTFKIDRKQRPQWYEYVFCGIQGIKDNMKEGTQLSGLSLVVYGDIPVSAGLSSSSALVCAAALSLAYCLDCHFTLMELAEICAKAEKHIGTEGGGMDQAASLLSQAGSAQLIEFGPLHCTPVSLPTGAAFVVVNSLAEKNKAASSDFNTRVMECRLACLILAKKCNINLGEEFVLGQLQKLLHRSFSEMIEIVKEFLHPQPYSKQEICQLLCMPSNKLDEDVLSANTRHITEFHLYKRALHVFTEASRVWQFKGLCDAWSSSNNDTTAVLQQLGNLMNESHDSARMLYECSHDRLEELVSLSKGVALGVRLTGAGWGGCIVALIQADRVKEYIEKLKTEYFLTHNFKIEDWSSVIFCTEPGDGACIYASQFL